MINIVFATLDCCMTTFTTKIAEEMCTRLMLEFCIHWIRLIVYVQGECMEVCRHLWEIDWFGGSSDVNHLLFEL